VEIGKYQKYGELLKSDSEPKVMNPLAVRCISCGKLIQSGSLCIQCKENAQLKEKVTKMENEFKNQVDELRNMYQTIMQSEIENNMINNFAEAKKRKNLKPKPM
jgi:hypothetical protein